MLKRIQFIGLLSMMAMTVAFGQPTEKIIKVAVDATGCNVDATGCNVDATAGAPACL